MKPSETTPGRRPSRRGIARVDMVMLQVQDVPNDLKRALVTAADGSNLNDVAVSILAKKFKVPFKRSGYVSEGANRPGDSGVLQLTMPRKLRRLIKNAAIERDIPARAIVLEVLSRSLLGSRK